jgi:SAM-dependent methyltransferase
MNSHESAIKSFWVARAKSSDRRASRFHAAHTAFDLNAIEMQLLGPSKILDLGCGGGEVAFALAEAGHNVTAVDFMPGFIAKIPDHPRISKAVSDARTFKAENQKFDAILMLGLITSFPTLADRELLYRHAFEMIEGNGVVFVKAQYGVDDEVLIDKWSDDLGMHYTGVYPWRNAEAEILGQWFDVILVDPYPSDLNKHSNTHMHYMIARPKQVERF